jgi:periodic tryptophan protein 1
MITAVSWIPKGNLKAVPDVAEPPSKEELKELIESGAFARNVEGSNEDEEEEIEEDGEEISEVDHAKAVAEALGKSSKSKAVSSSMEVDEVSQGLKELDMDNYDEEDDGTFSWPFGVCSAILQVIILISRDSLVCSLCKRYLFFWLCLDSEIELFSSGMGDLYYPSNEMDPYLKDVDDEDDEEDIDDTTVKPTDSVIICARNEDDVSHLEVYLYEESSGSPNMYVHHHIIIPEFPLCTAWLDCPLKGGEKGNFVAIGSKDTPTIEIWDLDVRDEVLPCIQLGGIEEMIVSKKKKSKKQKPKFKEGSHTESVLGLAWNKEFRNILASASADKKVKVWDVATGTCKITMEHHTKEVQAVAWNHYAPEVLLSGSFDQTVVMKDGRQPSHSGFKWSVMSDVESLAWDPHCEHSFVVSLEDGTVKGFDIRAAQSGSDSDLNPTYTIQAHAQDRGVSSISYNISTPNLLATGSMDKSVKLWDLSNNEPSCIATHQPNAGAVFSISFAVDNPFLLAIGGSKGELHVSGN